MDSQFKVKLLAASVIMGLGLTTLATPAFADEAKTADSPATVPASEKGISLDLTSIKPAIAPATSASVLGQINDLTNKAKSDSGPQTVAYDLDQAEKTLAEKLAAIEALPADHVDKKAFISWLESQGKIPATSIEANNLEGLTKLSKDEAIGSIGALTGNNGHDSFSYEAHGASASPAVDKWLSVDIKSKAGSGGATDVQAGSAYKNYTDRLTALANKIYGDGGIYKTLISAVFKGGDANGSAQAKLIVGDDSVTALAETGGALSKVKALYNAQLKYNHAYDLAKQIVNNNQLLLDKYLAAIDTVTTGQIDADEDTIKGVKHDYEQYKTKQANLLKADKIKETVTALKQIGTRVGTASVAEFDDGAEYGALKGAMADLVTRLEEVTNILGDSGSGLYQELANAADDLGSYSGTDITTRHKRTDGGTAFTIGLATPTTNTDSAVLANVKSAADNVTKALTPEGELAVSNALIAYMEELFYEARNNTGGIVEADVNAYLDLIGTPTDAADKDTYFGILKALHADQGTLKAETDKYALYRKSYIKDFLNSSSKGYELTQMIAEPNGGTEITEYFRARDALNAVDMALSRNALIQTVNGSTTPDNIYGTNSLITKAVATYQSDIAKPETVKATALSTLAGTVQWVAYGDEKVASPALAALNAQYDSAAEAQSEAAKQIEKANALLAQAKANYDAKVAAYNLAVEADKAGSTLQTRADLVHAQDDLKIAAAQSLDSDGKPVPLSDLKKIKSKDGVLLTSGQLGKKVVTKAGDNTDNRLAIEKQEIASQPYDDDHIITLADAKKSNASAVEDWLKVDSSAARFIELLANLQPLSSAAQQQQAQQMYSKLMNGCADDSCIRLTTTLKPLAEQETAAITDAEKGKYHTLYLGNLSSKDLSQIDNNGDLRRISVISGTGTGTVYNSFTESDLYTGSKAAPLKTTVLSIQAPTFGEQLKDGSSIMVGGSSAQNSMKVFASTYVGAQPELHSDLADAAAGLHLIDTGSGAAVRLAGNLRTGNVLDDKGIVIGGLNPLRNDRIKLQNMDIDNTLAQADRLAGFSGSAKSDNIGLLIASDTVNLLLNPKEIHVDGNASQVFEGKVTDGKALSSPNIVLDNVNVTVKNTSHINDARTELQYSGATAIQVDGSGNFISLSGKQISATKLGSIELLESERYDRRKPGTKPVNGTALLLKGDNNRIDITGASITGDIEDTHTFWNNKINLVNLKNANLTGNVISTHTPTGKNYLKVTMEGATWTGKSEKSPDMVFKNQHWNLTGESLLNSLTLQAANTINLVSQQGKGNLAEGYGPGNAKAHNLTVEQDMVAEKGSVLNLNAGVYSPDNVHRLTSVGLSSGYSFGSLWVEGLNLGDGVDAGKINVNLPSSGAEPVVVGNSLALNSEFGDTHAYRFVRYLTEQQRGATLVKSVNNFSGSPIEAGVYQYALTAKEGEKDESGDKWTSLYYTRNGQLSNSAAISASMAAAPVNVASMQSDALLKHMDSLRHSEGSGVWLSYFGGSNKNKLNMAGESTLKTNGVMLGADTNFADNNWLAGFAFSSAKSKLDIMNSNGDLTNYGAQFYVSRRYSNGMFIDSNAQFNHFSNTTKARMLDGERGNGDYSTNGFGLGVRVGYAWQNEDGFYAEPYVRATAQNFSGAAYNLGNGMVVNSTDYKSMMGELGANLGLHVDMDNGYLKPYLHLAVLDEFSNNDVHVNNITLDNNIKGAAFRVGLGGEVQFMKNLGGYVSFDYTKGGDIERPWQANVGVNYTW